MKTGLLRLDFTISWISFRGDPIISFEWKFDNWKILLWVELRLCVFSIDSNSSNSIFIRKEKKLTIFVVDIHSGNGDESLKSCFLFYLYFNRRMFLILLEIVQRLRIEFVINIFFLETCSSNLSNLSLVWTLAWVSKTK